MGGISHCQAIWWPSGWGPCYSSSREITAVRYGQIAWQATSAWCTMGGRKPPYTLLAAIIAGISLNKEKQVHAAGNSSEPWRPLVYCCR